MVEEAFPNYDTDAKEGESFRRFIAGLDQKLQTKIHELGGTTLTDALNIALRVERASQQVSSSIASAETKSEDVMYLQLLKRLDEIEKKFDKLNFNQQQGSTHLCKTRGQLHWPRGGLTRMGSNTAVNGKRLRQ